MSAIESTEPTIDDLVTEMRAEFLINYEKSPGDYSTIDVEIIKTSDYQIKRFLRYNNLNYKQAFNQMNEAMKWKKSFNIKRDYSLCGVEQFHCGGLFIYGTDLCGRPVLYTRVKTHVRVMEMYKLVQDIFVTTVETMNRLAGDDGFTVVIDVSGAGLANFDFTLTRFMLNVMRDYYPDSFGCILIVNLPIILRPACSFVKFMLGQKYSNIIHIINIDELSNFIDRAYVPKYLGGNSSHDFTQPPKECKLIAEDLANLYDMSKADVRRIMTRFEIHIEEAKRLVNS